MRRNPILTGVALALVGLGLAACGSNANSAGGGDVDPGGSFTVSYSVPPMPLDPHRVPSDIAFYTYGAPVYDRLTKIDANGELAPMLAESWEFSDDGLSLDFKLREGVTFSDGTAFDAEAVKANLDRARAEGSTVATRFLAVEDVVVVDPMTVRIVTTTPSANLPYTLAGMAGAMVSPEALDNPDLDLNPVGSGPYTVSELSVGDSVTYERRDGYWGPEENLPKTITAVGIPDDNARLNAVRSGQVDIAQVYPNFVEQAQDLGDGFEVYSFPKGTTQTIALNTTSPALSDVRVRQALNYAIDRDAISDALYNNSCEPTSQPLGAEMPGYLENPPIDYTYDPDKAKELLADAGYEDGFTFRVLVITGASVLETAATAVQAELEEIGIDMEILKKDATQAPVMFASGEYEGYSNSFQGNASAVAGLSSGFAPGRYFFGDWPEEFATALATANDPTTPESESVAALEGASAIANEQAFALYICTYGTTVVYNENTVTDVDEMGGSHYGGFLDYREVSALER